MRLSELYATLTPVERRNLASKVGVSAGYLWQLSTGWKGKTASLNLVANLVQADSRLTLDELVEEFATPRPATPQKEVA